MRTPENTHSTTFMNKGKKRKGRSCYTPTPSLGRSLLSQPSLMVQQNEERLRKGDGWQDNDLVFPNTLGKPMNAGNFYRRDFQPLLERAGLTEVAHHKVGCLLDTLPGMFSKSTLMPFPRIW